MRGPDIRLAKVSTAAIVEKKLACRDWSIMQDANACKAGSSVSPAPHNKSALVELVRNKT